MFFILFYISGLEQSVAGNYTCSASNLFGDDSITYSLVVVMPPRAPSLELQYTTTNSIRFRWNHPDNGGATIQGNDETVTCNYISYMLIKRIHLYQDTY